MRNLINYVSYVPRKFALAATVIAMLVAPFAGALSPANVAANDPEVRIEGKIGVANVTAGDTSYGESVNAKVDEVVKVQLWYHNMEEVDSGKIAQNLKVAINIPNTQGENQTITGTVGADNSNTVTDTAQVNLSLDNAYLEYIPGSAKWRHNKGTDSNVNYVTENISDDVVKSGGVFVENAKPCFNFEATVTVLARVKAQEVKVNKYVRKAGKTEWTLKNNAKPGDTLEYMIRFENKGNVELRNVMVGDNLPKYVSYVNGSTKLINTNNPNGRAISNDNVIKGGINVGHYSPGSAGYVVFKAKVDPVNVFEKCGTYTVKNVGVVRPEGMNEFYNTAHTNVKVVCALEPEEPEEPEEPAPEQPEELPVTGFGGALAGLFGSTGLAIAARGWAISRRKLTSALLEN